MRHLLLSCEHGGNSVPDEFQSIFKEADDVLKSHRGWDPGALQLAKAIQEAFSLPLFYETTTRLLIELNRSLHHPSLFSSYTKQLDKASKNHLINQYYIPYRKIVEEKINERISANHSVVHLSIHSFTPVLQGITRNCEIGLLYDPKRKIEKAFCAAWKTKIEEKEKGWRVRMNYPYKGTADGFTTYLRKRFKTGYAGIELEVNQGLLIDTPEEVNRIIIDSLKDLQ